MRVVDTVVHDGSGDILAGESHGPGLFHVQVKLRLTTRLSRVSLLKHFFFIIYFNYN